MDRQKIEAEFLFYGFTLNRFKEQRIFLYFSTIDSMYLYFFYYFCSFFFLPIDERLVHSHTKKLMETLMENIVEGVPQELSVEIGSKLKKIAETENPEMMELIRKFNNTTDKYLTIPKNVPLYMEYYDKHTTAELIAEEEQLNKRINELRVVYMQQEAMINKLHKEMELYETVLDLEADIDSRLCDLIEKFMHENNLETEGSILTILKNLENKK